MKGALNHLRALGFDLAKHIPFTKHYAVKCSQCQAATINGIPTHETGCPNQVYWCKGCDTQVERKGSYCPDCQ